MFGDKIKDFEPYIPFAYTEGQVRLDANESPYDLPDGIKNKIYEGIKSIDFDRYPDPNATELCSAFADYYGVESESVVAGNGSDELLSLILSVALKKGSKITVTKPDFSMYSFYSTLGENNVNVYAKGEGDAFDPMAFAEAARGSDIAIFSNPCNPTGSIVSASDVLKMADATDALLIVDEAYMDFADESVIENVLSAKILWCSKPSLRALGVRL